jgi:hypothetical protein
MCRELNYTCLGSLYIQDFPGAMSLCEMKIIEQMRPKDDVLISDFSLRLDSTIKHYEWDLDEVAFLPEERSISA